MYKRKKECYYQITVKCNCNISHSKDEKIMDINKIIKNMTLREKICQLTQVCIPVTKYEDALERIKKEPIGTIITAGGANAGNDAQSPINADNMNEIQRISMEKHGMPILVGRDVIHGHHIVLPIPLGLGATFNPELVEEGYRAVAEEAKSNGINWTYAPMVDVSRDPRWGRIIESAGEDTYVNAKIGEAIVYGFQGREEKINVAACAKHFVGYGAAFGGRDTHSSEISEYALRNYYLPPFEAAVKAGVASVMNSFNEVSGEPVASSRYLLTDILRGEWGFDGFVVSDWGSVNQLQNQGVAEDAPHAAELAINAGLEVEMVNKEYYYKHLEQLVEEGRVSMETIDEAVRRVLRIKDKMGLFENPYTDKKEYDRESHREIARKVAEEAMVLLKNENNALPLKKDEKIVVMGPFAKDRRSILGSWTCDFDINESITVLEGIEKHAENVMYLNYDNPEYKELAWTVNEDMGYDTAIVVIGESYALTGEANCLAKIELTDAQREIIRFARRHCKKVVGLFAFGRPRAMYEDIDMLDAVLYMWHAGSQTGNAAANILFGEVSPSGKLPVTMPKQTGQVPIFYNMHPVARCRQSYYEKQANNTYKDIDGKPLFPFGYGLSYTEFEYGNIKIKEDKISLSDIENGKCFEISIDVKNVGGFDAKETVQCYVHDVVASMTRPVKELKDFKKCYIEQGKTETFTFKIGYDKLGFFRRDSKFAVEKGKFRIYIGKDCYTENFVDVEVV